MEALIKDLEFLRQQLPDPFRMRGDINHFYNSPVAKKLMEDGQASVDDILEYLGEDPQPSLVVPAILMLAAFEPLSFYKRLIEVLKTTSHPVTEAFEHGFWLIKKEEEQLAASLVEIAGQNPNVLLLLQRPVVKKYKANLQQWIEGRNDQLSLFAMYCYRYVLEEEDILWVEKIKNETTLREIKRLAGEYLQQLTE